MDLLFVVAHSVEHLIIIIMNEQALRHHARLRTRTVNASYIPFKRFAFQIEWRFVYPKWAPIQ